MRAVYPGLVLTLMLLHQGLSAQEPVASPRPQRVLKDHPQLQVWALAFSPDGRLLAAAGWETNTPCVVQLFEVKTGKVVATLKGHRSGINAVAFAPDGKTLATAGHDGTLRLWNATGQLIKTLVEQKEPLRAVAFSSDGTQLAASGDSPILCRIHLRTGKVDSFRAGLGRVSSLGFTGDGKRLAVVRGHLFGYRGVELWDLATLKMAAELKDSSPWRLQNLALSKDGKALAAANEGRGRLYLWDTGAWRLLRSWGEGDPLAPPDRIKSLAFFPDGKRLLTAHAEYRDAASVARAFTAAGKPVPATLQLSWTVAKVWDTAFGKEVARLEAPVAMNGSAQQVPVAVSPDARVLALAAGHDIYIWPAPAHTPLRMIQESGDSAAAAVVFQPDGKRAAIGLTWTDSDKKPAHRFLIFDPALGRAVYQAESATEQVVPLAFLSGDRLLLAVSPTREEKGRTQQLTFRLWDAARQKTARSVLGPPGMNHVQLHLPGQDSWGNAALSPNGETLAWIDGTRGKSETRYQVGLWDLTTGKPPGPKLQPLEPVKDQERSFSRGMFTFSADGSQLMLAGLPFRSPLRWDVKTGRKTVLPWKEALGGWVFFSADGNILFTTNREDGVVWDFRAQKERLRRRGGFLLTPDGRKLAVHAGKLNAKEVAVLDVMTGRELFRVPTPKGLSFSHSAVSADSKTLVLLDDRKHVAIALDLVTGKERGRARLHVDKVQKIFCSPEGRTLAVTGSSRSAGSRRCEVEFLDLGPRR